MLWLPGCHGAASDKSLVHYTPYMAAGVCLLRPQQHHNHIIMTIRKSIIDVAGIGSCCYVTCRDGDICFCCQRPMCPAAYPASGEYVAVEHLESQFGKSALVEQIWVHGSSFESVLVAVVVPNKEPLTRWAKEQVCCVSRPDSWGTRAECLGCPGSNYYSCTLQSLLAAFASTDSLVFSTSW